MLPPALASARQIAGAAGAGDPFDFALASPLAAPASSASAVVSSWGENDSGELGDGGEAESDVPLETGLSGVTALASGGYHSLALLEGGTVMAWGDDGVGQLGVGTTTGPEKCSNQYPCSRVPIEVPALKGVTAIAGGSLHSLALLSNGTVMAWGENREGQLGDGSTENSDVPVLVPGLSGVTAIAAGGEHSLALLSNGTAMEWGLKQFGQHSDVPEPVGELSGVVAIGAGYHHSLAVLGNGTVKAWGEDSEGQLGGGFTTEYDSSPVTVCAVGESYPCSNDLTGAVAVAGGDEYSMALLGNGTVVAWGFNSWGELGNGSNSASDVPVPVSGASEVTAIAGGDDYALDLSRNGIVRGWGDDLEGQLGDDETNTVNTPVPVSGLREAVAISAGQSHSDALGGPLAFPQVLSIAPDSGSLDGGTTVTVTGKRFAGATAVKFGGTSAASFEVVSETEIKAVSPAGTKTVEVMVETPGGTSPKSPADQFTYTPVLEGGELQLYDNFVKLGKAPVGVLGWGPIKLTAPALETEIECVNLAFGSAWNEGSPSLARGQVLGWSASGDASKTGTELNRECRFKKGGSVEAWVSDEPALTRSGGVGEHTAPLSVPWNVELRCGEREETEVTIVKIGVPNGAAPSTGCESEPAELEATKKEEEERRGCYASPVPAGCIKVNIVQPALGLETVFEGSVGARVLDGSGNGLNASRLRVEGASSGRLRLSTAFATEATMTREVWVSGLGGNELLQAK